MLTKRAKTTQRFQGIDATALGSVMGSVLLVLVVLVMFTPRLRRGGDVQPDLPKAYHSSLMKGADRDDALVITVLRMGYCYLGPNLVATQDLPNKIRDGLSHGAERKIYIRADARANYKDIKAVVDAIHQSGVENIAFVVDQRLPGEQKTSSLVRPFPSKN